MYSLFVKVELLVGDRYFLSALFSPNMDKIRYQSLEDSSEQPDNFHQKERRSLHPLAILAIILVTNTITFLSSQAWKYPKDVVVENLGSFMNSIDRSLQVETYTPFDFNFSVYTMPTELAGDEVEKYWADLGIFTAPIIVPVEDAALYNIDSNHHRLLKIDEYVSNSSKLSPAYAVFQRKQPRTSLRWVSCEDPIPPSAALP
jgi:hypothetical protein